MSRDRYLAAPRLPDVNPFDPRSFLGSGSDPVELEIGPGRGWFLVERLNAFPDVRMVGLEIRRKWATIVDERLHKLQLSHRGRVLAEDAGEVLPKWVDGCLAAAFIHFPDPWWKRRHAKRRVIDQPLVGTLARLLAPGGELFVQTDVRELAESVEAMVSGESQFGPVEESAWVGGQPYGARSPREKRVTADGLQVFRLRYRRLGPNPAAPPVIVPVTGEGG